MLPRPRPPPPDIYGEGAPRALTQQLFLEFRAAPLVLGLIHRPGRRQPQPDLNAFARGLLVSVLQAGLQFARTGLWGERGGRVFRAAQQGGPDSHWTGETWTPTCDTHTHKRARARKGRETEQREACAPFYAFNVCAAKLLATFLLLQVSSKY